MSAILWPYQAAKGALQAGVRTMSAASALMPVVRRHFETIDSTNTFAKTHAKEFDQDAITVISADEQTAGRGRMGRTWISSGKDIKVTFAFRIPAAAMKSAYQLSPFLSVVARRAFAQNGIDVQIKWPNDLIIGGCRKLGGILCEMESVPGGSYFAVLGIGININSTPEALGVARPVWPLTTLRAETGKEQDVTKLLEDLIAAFASALPIYLSSGFAPFQAEYEAASVLLGKRVRFSLGEGAAVQGIVSKIGEDGKLYITRDGSTQLEGYLSGEVSGIELAPGNVVEGAPGHE